MNSRKRKFDSLTDLKEFLEQEKIEIISFNGHQLSTSLGVFALATPVLYLDGESLTGDSLNELITAKKNQNATN